MVRNRIRVKASLKRAGISQRAFADYIGVLLSTVSRWVRFGATNRKDVQKFVARVSKYLPRSELSEKQLERRTAFFEKKKPKQEERKPFEFVQPTEKIQSSWLDFFQTVVNRSIDGKTNRVQIYRSGQLVFSGTVKDFIASRVGIQRQLRNNFRDDKAGYWKINPRDIEIEAQSISIFF